MRKTAACFWKWVSLAVVILSIVGSVSAICDFSFVDRNKLYNYSLASPIRNFPHGVRSEDGWVGLWIFGYRQLKCTWLNWLNLLLLLYGLFGMMHSTCLMKCVNAIRITFSLENNDLCTKRSWLFPHRKKFGESDHLHCYNL